MTRVQALYLPGPRQSVESPYKAAGSVARGPSIVPRRKDSSSCFGDPLGSAWVSIWLLGIDFGGGCFSAQSPRVLMQSKGQQQAESHLCHDGCFTWFAAVHDINPASPSIYYTTTFPRVVACRVKQGFYHQQPSGQACIAGGWKGCDCSGTRRSQETTSNT